MTAKKVACMSIKYIMFNKKICYFNLNWLENWNGIECILHIFKLNIQHMALEFHQSHMLYIELKCLSLLYCIKGLITLCWEMLKSHLLKITIVQ